MFLLLLVLIVVVAVVLLWVVIPWVLRPIRTAAFYLKSPAADQVDTTPYPHPSDPKKIVRFACLGDAAGECDLTVVVPAFNEQERIVSMLRETVAFLSQQRTNNSALRFEIIVVDDASTDNTVEIVKKQMEIFKDVDLKVLRLKSNRGKGGAIRCGALVASGDRILMADADGATDITDLPKLEQLLQQEKERNQTGVVICGSRAHLEKEAISKRHPLRNLLMHGFHFIVSTVCVSQIRDTQCGFKLFDRKAAQLIFPTLHIERWAFDVEMLFIAASQKVLVKEVAVNWTEIPGSKLDVISATLTMLREIILIRLCYMFGVWKVSDGAFRLKRHNK